MGRARSGSSKELITAMARNVERSAQRLDRAVLDRTQATPNAFPQEAGSTIEETSDTEPLSETAPGATLGVVAAVEEGTEPLGSGGTQVSEVAEAEGEAVSSDAHPASVPDEAPGSAAEGQQLPVYALPLERIVVGGINTRVIDEEDAEFQELVDSIRSKGLLQPVLVGVEDDHYRLIAGERRFRAVRALELPTILACVTTSPSSEWRSLMLVENLHRKEMEPWEEAAGYQSLLEAGLTLAQIGRDVGKGKGHVSLVLKLTRNDSILLAMKERAIGSITLARELAPLINANGEEKTPGVIDRAIEFIKRAKPTMVQLRQWVSQSLAAPDVTLGVRGRGVSRTIRGTYLKSEEGRLQEALTRKAPQLSRLEMEWLATLYEAHAQTLRALAQAEENTKLAE